MNKNNKESNEAKERRYFGSIPLSEFYKEKVGDIMVREIPIVEKGASIGTVAKILRTRHHMWVVESQDSMKLVGLITERDFLEILSPLPPRSWVVGMIKPKSWHHSEFEHAEDIMRIDLVCCEQESSLGDVIPKMSKHRRLPVSENGKLIGEITLGAMVGSYLSKVREQEE